MARAKKRDEDVAVDSFGRPLPTVLLRTKGGDELEVHDVGALSNLHYGHGMDFAEDGMTYPKALAELLGEAREQALVDVPTDGGDVVWPVPGAPGAESPAEPTGADPKSKSAKTD